MDCILIYLTLCGIFPGLVISGRARGYASYPFRLRPIPSDDMPVMDLIESKDRRYDPRPEDMNIQKLKRRLGGQYDPDYMSVRKPREHVFNPNGTVELPYKRNKKGHLMAVAPIPKHIRKINLKYITLPNGQKVRTNIGKKSRKKVNRFLWAYTYCPVLHKWKDLGSRFWPRWIREGQCNFRETSCSFPPGMHCKASRFINKTILRWHCKDWTHATRCQWLYATYPLISECSCGCSHSDSH